MSDSTTGQSPGQETSTKPYMVRALYEWCCDNGYTPYLAVSVDEHTVVPRQYVKGGEIVLNVSPTATSRLSMGNDWIEFQARFGGVAQQLSIPVANVSAIYARETGHGMAFEVSRIPPMAQPADADDRAGDTAAEAPPGHGANGRAQPAAKPARRSHLSDVSAKPAGDSAHGSGGRGEVRGGAHAGGEGGGGPLARGAAYAGTDENAKGEVIEFKSPAARRPRRGAGTSKASGASKGGAKAEAGQGAEAALPVVAVVDTPASAAGRPSRTTETSGASKDGDARDPTPPDDGPDGQGGQGGKGGKGGNGSARGKAQLTRIK